MYAYPVAPSAQFSYPRFLFSSNCFNARFYQGLLSIRTLTCVPLRDGFITSCQKTIGYPNVLIAETQL